MAAEALPVRVLGDQRVDLRHHLGVPSERELRVEQLLDRADPQLGQPVGLTRGERLEGEIAERGAAP